MIFLLIGVIDSLPPIPDPFLFEIESLPRPAFRRQLQKYDLAINFGNPIGGAFSYSSYHSLIDLKYTRGKDWVDYSEAEIKGNIAIPVKRSLSRVNLSYIYQTRIDTLNNFHTNFNLTGVNDLIFHLGGRYDYNTISDSVRDEYAIAPAIIARKIPFNPFIKMNRIKSAFSNFWGIEIGGKFYAFTVAAEYKNKIPGFRIRFDRLLGSFRPVLEVERTVQPIFIKDLFNLEPTRYSESIQTPRKKIGASVHLITNPIEFGINYQLWDSFPEPNSDDLYGKMDKATDITGFFQVNRFSVVDSIRLNLAYSDRQYDPEITSSIMLSLFQLLYLNTIVDVYQDFVVVAPGLSLSKYHFEVGFQYFPSTSEIYPSYHLTERYAMFLRWEKSY